MSDNRYVYDTRRTRCPYCGSSDGFAQVLDPATGKPVGDQYGKCHSCNVFRTPQEGGYVAEGGSLVAATGVVDAKHFSPFDVSKNGLRYGVGPLVDWAEERAPIRARERASHMYVCGDSWGNQTFIYVDIRFRGTSSKTIRYENGHRDKAGIAAGGRRFDTAQISGYVTAEGALRVASVGDGYYQLLYGQHQLSDSAKPVVVVESEKTAYLGGLITNEFIFLASGGSQGLTQRKVKTLLKAGAVHDELVQALRDRPILVMYDNDASGRAGSTQAAAALAELGATKVVVENFGDILSAISSPMPIEKWQAADIADLWEWDPEACEPAVSRMLEIAGFRVDPVYERAKKSMKSLGVEAYVRPAPEPSMTLTDMKNGSVSTLAIPSNIVTLLASSGVGKSSVVASIVARHIRSSADAFGIDVDAPNGIIVLDTEQSEDQVVMLHKRLARRAGFMAQDLPGIFEDMKVQWLTMDKRQSPADAIENLFAYIRKSNPSMVIVDQIASLVAKVNDEAETRSLVGRIAIDAEENGRTWLVVIHTNPRDDKGRGVLGSELWRHSASVLFIKKPQSEGEPSLLTTHHVDGTMPKVRAGAPVRCFFSWDSSRGDFYPTDRGMSTDINQTILVTALRDAFTAEAGMSQPLRMSEARKALESAMGKSDGSKAFSFLISNNMFKTFPGGKLWPDWEKLESSKPASE